MKDKLKLVLSIIVVSILVIVLYVIFEGAVNWAIDAFWIDLLNTQNNRILTILATIGIGIIFFSTIHFIDKPGDKKANKKQSQVYKLIAVVVIGFFSLFAGAALGPEAILIPSSLLIGQLISNFIFKSNKQTAKILGLAGFVALFVAFFNSILGGLLGFYLATKISKQKPNKFTFLVFIISSLAALVSLNLLDNKGSFAFPPSSTNYSILSVVFFIGFFLGGMLYQKILAICVKYFKQLKNDYSSTWLANALFASIGLAVIFLVGGYYVQFTGNRNIGPIFTDATQIGVLGLIWISLIKTVAIAWSSTFGYRGGLVFPTVFVASSIAALVSLYTTNFHVVAAILVVVAGALYADKKDNVIIENLGS
ncbi:chloride channel protein [Candidatus Saccharibacteria bacterium]|nr:chloride channel protein [Candidatus Saccharibacteria bacterium]